MWERLLGIKYLSAEVNLLNVENNLTQFFILLPLKLFVIYDYYQQRQS